MQRTRTYGLGDVPGSRLKSCIVWFRVASSRVASLVASHRVTSARRNATIPSHRIASPERDETIRSHRPVSHRRVTHRPRDASAAWNPVKHFVRQSARALPPGSAGPGLGLLHSWTPCKIYRWPCPVRLGRHCRRSGRPPNKKNLWFSSNMYCKIYRYCKNGVARRSAPAVASCTPSMRP